MTGKLLMPMRTQHGIAEDKLNATAGSITDTAVHRMTSDDFVTAEEVGDQLVRLKDYLASKREEEPSYLLPTPSGWKLMVLMLTVPQTTKGGVHIVADNLEAKAMSSPQGVILAMGPAAYQDPERFAISGAMAPWHGVGDRIIWVKYDANTFQLSNGQRLGFMNDTQPVGTIDTGWSIPQ